VLLRMIPADEHVEAPTEQQPHEAVQGYMLAGARLTAAA
jgi:hypothetical protein